MNLSLSERRSMLNIRHTGIVVSDIDESIKFYCDLLGFKIKKDMLESGEYIDNFSALKNAQVRTVKMSLENDKSFFQVSFTFSLFFIELLKPSLLLSI